MSDLMLGLQGLVLGLGSVFLILLLLILLIVIMSKIIQASGKTDKSITKSAPAKAEASAEDDEDEVIAAITAAIACMAQREGKKFKIRSFKRV